MIKTGRRLLGGRLLGGRLLRGLGALCLTFAGAAASAAPADMILENGTVLTMEGPEKSAGAIALQDGRIVAVGEAALSSAMRGPETKIVDLRGNTVLPGFIDAHGHVFGSAALAGLANLSSPPAGPVNTIDELLNALRALAKTPPPSEGGWIIGYGYDDSLLAEKRHPTRADLDLVSTERPVAIIHVSGHLGAANSKALALAGITADSKNPAGGIIRREADGRTPNGVLEETAHFQMIGRSFADDRRDFAKNMIAAQKSYAGYGITTAQEGSAGAPQLAGLKAMAAAGVLWLDTVVLPQAAVAFAKPEDVPGRAYKGNLRRGGVKLMLDGSPQGRTAWLKHPVPVPPAGQEEGYRGYPALTDAQLDDYVARARKHGWQIWAHVNGDAAAEQLINAIEKGGISPDARTIAIHNQVVTRDQLARMKKLGIHPTFFSAHTFFWGDWHREVALGPKRADFISPLRAALEAGLVPTTHNDSPIVPPDMMRLVWATVNRRSRSGDILGPDQRLSPYEALLTITANAAWQIGEEDTKGTLTPGKRADIVVLGSNPLTVQPDAIKDIKVVATLKDGRLVHGSLD